MDIVTAICEHGYTTWESTRYFRHISKLDLSNKAVGKDAERARRIYTFVGLSRLSTIDFLPVRWQERAGKQNYSMLRVWDDIPGMAGMISRGWEAGVKALDREAARAARP